MLVLELVAHIVQQQLVKVVAAQLRVAMTGQHLDNAALDLDNRDIEGAAAQIVDQQTFVLLGMRFVGECGRCRFIDDAHNFQTRQFARLARGLTLVVVKERGDRDHRLGQRLAQCLLGTALQGPQDHGRDFLGRIRLFAEHDFCLVSHLAFDRLDGPLRCEQRLVTRCLADEHASGLIHADDRG